MEELSILDLVKILMKRIWFIVGVAVIATLLAFVATKLLITPKYQATGTMYIKGEETNISVNEVLQSQKLVNSYVEVLKSRTAAKKVLAATGLDYTEDEIREMIGMSASNETEVMVIKVTCTEPGDAIIIANALMDIAPEYLDDIIKVGNASVIDPAEEAVLASPSVIKNTLLGFLIGLIVACGIVLTLFFLDQSIKGEEDFTETYKLPLLGVVPDFEQSTKGGYYRYEN